MHRAQAILVIFALLSAPLALLAHSAGADAAACGGMCCLPHHGHQHPASHQASAAGHQHQSEACDHGATSPMPNCAFDCGHPRQDYSFLSPIAPTKPSTLTSIARFDSPKSFSFLAIPQNVTPGFLATPFQPPRA
jgi:hypothetical protein